MAGHVGGPEGHRLIALALDDPDPAVRATALGAADRLGTLPDERLVACLERDEPVPRRRAIELLARRAPHPATDAALVARLRRSWVDTPDEVELIAWCLGERHQTDHETDPEAGPEADAETGPGARDAAAVPPEVLRALTDTAAHPDALCREAAVAALGAIGDPTSLPVVLRAAADKATVRRRAVVALAAFDGPEVDAALAVAATDRDWQVRQIAEDLLAEDPLGEAGAAGQAGQAGQAGAAGAHHEPGPRAV